MSKNNNNNNKQPNYPGLWPPPPKDKYAPPSPERIPLGVRLGNPYDPALRSRRQSASQGAPPAAGATTQGFHGQTTTSTPTQQPQAQPLAGLGKTNTSGSPPGPGNSYLSQNREKLLGYGGTAGAFYQDDGKNGSGGGNGGQSGKGGQSGNLNSGSSSSGNGSGSYRG